MPEKVGVAGQRKLVFSLNVEKIVLDSVDNLEDILSLIKKIFMKYLLEARGRDFQLIYPCDSFSTPVTFILPLP